MLPAVNKVKDIFYFLRSENWFTFCHPPHEQTTHYLLTLNESHTEGSFTTVMGSQDHRACGLLVVVAVIHRVCVASWLLLRLITGRDDSGVVRPPEKNTAKTDNFPRNRFVFGSWGTREQWAALIHWLTHSSDAHMMSSTTMPCNLGRAEPPFLKQTLWILGVFSVMCPLAR